MAIELDKLAGPDGGNESRRLAKHWLDQIYSVKDNVEFKRWFKRGEKIEKRFRDDRNRVDEEGSRRYSSLWSNFEILKPALYGRPALPVAERRFKDKDPVGRSASTILERALRNEIEINGFDEAMQQSVSDYLLPGRGTVWVRYEPEIEESVSLPPETQDDRRDAQGELPTDREANNDEETPDNTVTTPKGRKRPRLLSLSNQPEEQSQAGDDEHELEEEKLRSTGDRVVRESTPVDFVQWPDFFTFPVRARVWAEVTAVGKRIYMSRDQMNRRFGKRIGKHIPLEKDDRGQKVLNTNQQPQTSQSDQDKGQIYEIWSKDDETVYWVAMGYDYLCDRKEDPLELENFYPCPKPLYANPTTSTLVPVPDYIQYQDQAIQIDELTQRIAMLTKACKMTGVYNAAAKDIQRMFSENIENELIPVDDWAAFAEDGGVEGNISWMPIQQIKDVINELVQIKQQQIEEMNQLTGINDIMRGTSDARETLGGVRLKTNTTGTRLTSRQNEVARFARDVVRIMADIMCQHFSPRSLIEASGILYEEGLGPDDTPPLTELQNGVQPPQLPQTMPPVARPPPVSGPPMSGQPPGGAGGMAGGGMPQPPMGQNVIPFRPPGAPMAPQAPGMPAGAPEPEVPPELLAKFKALQRIAEAIKLLRNERLRGFRVDIEVDSTIFADITQDKEARTEFVVAVTGYLEKSLSIGAAMPEAIPLLGKLLAFTARGHRVGRDVETAIEDFIDQAPEMMKKMQEKAATQPNPEQLKAQAVMMKAQSDIENNKVKQQGDMQKNQFDLQAAQMDTQAQIKAADAEIERQRIENEGERLNSAVDMQMKQIDLQIKLVEKRMEEMRMQMEMAKMGLEVHQAVREDATHRLEMRHEAKQASLEHAQSKLEMKHEKEQTEREGEQSEIEAKHDKEKTRLEITAARAKAKAAPKGSS